MDYWDDGVAVQNEKAVYPPIAHITAHFSFFCQGSTRLYIINFKAGIEHPF